jgi:transcription termination factor NusB
MFEKGNTMGKRITKDNASAMQLKSAKKRTENTAKRRKMRELLADEFYAIQEDGKTKAERSAQVLSDKMADGDVQAINAGLKILGELTEQVQLEVSAKELTAEEAAELIQELEETM